MRTTPQVDEEDEWGNCTFLVKFLPRFLFLYVFRENTGKKGMRVNFGFFNVVSCPGCWI